MMNQRLITSREPALTFGRFCLVRGRRLLLRDGVPVRLGSRAREVLHVLTENPGHLVRKAELISRVWPHSIVEEGTLRVHIAALRKALGETRDGLNYVENVTGHGYRFIASTTSIAAAPESMPERPAANDSQHITAQLDRALQPVLRAFGDCPVRVTASNAGGRCTGIEVLIRTRLESAGALLGPVMSRLANLSIPHRVIISYRL